jgi:hypothetical protein
MTDAGMALAHLVAARGIGQVRERFGRFSAGGATIERPQLSAGRLYAGKLTASNRQQDIELYLSTRADRSLFGLLYYVPTGAGVAADLWIPLIDLRAGNGRLTFAHRPAPGRVGSGDFTIHAEADPLFVSGDATVDGVDWQLAAVLQLAGSYTVPTAAATRSDPRLRDGTWGIEGRAWAPLIITRYQQNSGLSNARQLLVTWRHLDCPPVGTIVPAGGKISLSLLPSVSNPLDPLPEPVTRQLFFTGHSLVDSAGATIFERAPDGVETWSKT